MTPLAFKRDWRTAFQALRKLLANGDDTVQVFRIMRALNAGASRENYRRLTDTVEGGRLAAAQVELSKRFSDRTFVEAFAPGTVGAAYRAFLDETGYSAQGLAEISYADDVGRDVEHPYAWFGRRERDVHDIWHILTGYRADEPLGEASLVAFSYAQTNGLGWAFIALGAAVKSIKETRSLAVVRSILEGWRHGKAAAWLAGEDYEALFAEPLESARRRLNIAPPARYREAQAMLERLGSKNFLGNAQAA
jgi:ubiquinone biosynthesis protein COQ4